MGRPAAVTAYAVVLSCPLTDQTRGLMNDAAFAAMPSSAYLINVARGGGVDEATLLRALGARQIAGATDLLNQIV